MEELRPGLLHWSAHHEGIGQDVSSHYLVDAATLLDPMLPAQGLDSFAGMEPLQIVLTCRHHRRACAEFADRFRCPVLVHEAGLADYEDEDDFEVRPYAAGDELAPGIEVLELGTICPDDVVLALTAIDGGALAFGDGVINYGAPGFVPDSLIGDDPQGVKSATVDGVRPMIDRQPDTLLFAHGMPIVGDGTEALETFVEQYG